MCLALSLSFCAITVETGGDEKEGEERESKKDKDTIAYVSVLRN